MERSHRPGTLAEVDVIPFTLEVEKILIPVPSPL